MTFGDVKMKNDFSIDLNYQVVQAQAIPFLDIAGIGNFSPAGVGRFTNTTDGFSNYKGYVATFLYGITDNLNIQLIFQKSRPANTHIASGCGKTKTIEITTIYSF